MSQRRVIFNLLVFCIVAVMSHPCDSRAAEFELVDKWSRVIHPAVVYTHYKYKIDGEPLHIYLLSVSLDNDGIEVRPMLADNRLDSLETVKSMAERTGALAAVNGSFFNSSASNPFPVGFIMINGRTIYFSHHTRSAFGLTREKVPIFGYPHTRGIIYIEKSGEYFFLDGMNVKRGENDVLVYTPEYSLTSGTGDDGREVVVAGDRVVKLGRGNSEIPANGFVVSMHGENRKFYDWFSPGDYVRLYFVVEPSWLKVYNAITGGPMLLRGGRPVTEKSKSEGLRQGLKKRIPLTAVGNTLDGRLLLAVADGRQKNYSVGLTYGEFADFMKSVGAINAIGMDGGGSSTMVIKNEVKNKPSDGRPRRVANGIGVFTGDW
ncbi:MAG TPA: phosphodiester glycosidase family protein [bacterium]|nr:phosphodiester glycosidase family protein [bacterium]